MNWGVKKSFCGLLYGNIWKILFTVAEQNR